MTNPPIHQQFTNPMPIHDSPSNPRPIGQFQFRSHTNLPIHYQSISPMPILDQSSNLIPTLDQSLTNPPKRCNPCPIPNQVANFDSYANPIPICQSNANLPILDLSPSPMPIHEQSTHPNILNHYHKLLPIFGQSSTPWSIREAPCKDFRCSTGILP